MKILSRGGNWQTGLASRTILLQLFCDCPTVAPLHSSVAKKLPHKLQKMLTTVFFNFGRKKLKI
jgi:hypothetical protein